MVGMMSPTAVWPPVAAGDLHTVMIVKDRQSAIACGDNHFGQCTAPTLPPNQHAVAVAAGRNHSVVLLDNGRVVAFGRNDDGQCDVPGFLKDHRAVCVAAGDSHTVVLLDDGNVIAFGFNGSGQCDVPDYGGERHALYVAAGGSHTLVLLDDGDVIAFGNDSYGQCTVPSFPKGQRVVAMAAGGYHTVVLLQNGRVLAFGWNVSGQCSVPTFPLGRTATSVAAGERHTVVLLDDGQVLAFGDNDVGQCTVPTWPEEQRAVAIAAGGCHTAILFDQDKVGFQKAVAFGQNREGQCSLDRALAEQPSVASETALDVSRRSISLHSLLHFFHVLAREKFDIHRDATTQDVAQEIILRLTAKKKSSYVDLLESQKGVKARVDEGVTHVAHSWQMRFVDLVRSIVRHASGGDMWQLGSSFEDACRLYEPFLHKRYWVCLFCVNEHRSICGDPFIKCTCNLEKYKEASPRCEYDKFESVAEILHDRGDSMIVALDSELHAFRRAWVMEEMYIAIQQGLRMDVSFGTLPALNSLRRFCCDVAKSEGPVAENNRILDRVQKKVAGGVEEFNRTITDFVRMSELRLAAVTKKVAATLDDTGAANMEHEPVWKDTTRLRL
eukprot:TRINITY_DN8664_c0_g1_i1.p1 TRINITY_DN8664_c0_g1~~TRINITY_DN8664_c0_g1_i1.p1  ORF type:complete len:651 (-),score=107.70 TRINITY_DN8664_c0_g1_i1:1777-3606(-)